MQTDKTDIWVLLTIVVSLLFIYLVVPRVSAAPVYIAQGDPAQFQMLNPAGQCWYFPQGEIDDHNKFFGIPAIHYGMENYTCELSSVQTASMPEGNYDLVYVYPSKLETNTIPSAYLADLSWNRNLSRIESLFGTVWYEFGKQSFMVKKDLIEAVSQSRLDKSEIYQITINAPMLSITRQEESGWDYITISGESNLADGTPVRIEVDEFNRNLENYKEIDKWYNFTEYTTVHRNYIEEKGTWSFDMHLPIQLMTPGWHTTTVYAGGLESSARFPIYQAWQPTPEPKQYLNYFGNGSIKPDIVTVTVPVPGPTEYIDRWHTATPTPPITDALGDTVPYPYKTNNDISASAGLVGLLAITAVTVMRDRK